MDSQQSGTPQGLPQGTAPTPQGAPQPARPVARPIAQPAGQRPVPAQGRRPVPANGKVNRPVPVKPGTTMPREDAEPEEETNPLADYIKDAPAWMVSAVFHMLILIVLGLWFIWPKDSNVVTLDATVAEDLGEPEADPDLSVKLESPDLETVITPQNLPPVDDPFATPPELPITALEAPNMSGTIKGPAGLADGRNEGSKEYLRSKYGGSGTEKNVLWGLEWLARQQRQDGSWSLQAPYSDGGTMENMLAATAMAMLAFQGDGHTHHKGKFKENVSKGIKYLLKMQNDAGTFPVPSSHAMMYTHGQCTIVLCELYAMTKDPEVKTAAEKAIKYCVDNQSNEGGWRYHPQDDASDTSVTGWILMGLQSGKMAGLDVPQTTFDNVTRYLTLATTNGGSLYGYLPNTANPTNAMTAEALLCRQYLGWARDNEHLQRGVDFLSTNAPPNWGARDVYYWYYATQVMHHMEGDVWKKWNDRMKPLLVNNQVKAGKEKGSWHPGGDEWGPHAGRLYVTCLSLYMLEVYYRHLPLYSDVRLR